MPERCHSLFRFPKQPREPTAITASAQFAVKPLQQISRTTFPKFLAQLIQANPAPWTETIFVSEDLPITTVNCSEPRPRHIFVQKPGSRFGNPQEKPVSRIPWIQSLGDRGALR